MSRDAHHRIHAMDRLQRARIRVAQEAARMMCESGIRDFHHAKLKAAERLGVLENQALPRNQEIEEALREHQRLFQLHTQPQWLATRRQAACEAMRFLARFEPRLVGAVLDGTADAHSAICLQVFSDTPENVALFLREQGVPYKIQARRLRINREQHAEFPALLFSADQLTVDLTVLPLKLLRQAPLDRIHERPMQRATLTMLQALMEAEDLEHARDFAWANRGTA